MAKYRHIDTVRIFGMLFLGHSCLPNIGSNLLQERLTKTRLRLQYTLEIGYGLELMSECELKRRIRMDGDVGRFVKTFEEVWYPKWPRCQPNTRCWMQSKMGVSAGWLDVICGSP